MLVVEEKVEGMSGWVDQAVDSSRELADTMERLAKE